MKTIAFTIMLFASTCGASEQEQIRSFARDIQHIVACGDKKEFKKIPVFPNMHVSDEAISYIFGKSGDDHGFVGFFRRDPAVRIYGPDVPDDSHGYRIYSIVFYDPEMIVPSETGNFDTASIKKYWGIAILETRAIVADGMAMFHRAPFYYGSHAPWAEDY